MRFEVYQDAGQLWRWRLRAPNGKIVADGGEGYVTKFSVERAIQRVRAEAPLAEVVVL